MNAKYNKRIFSSHYYKNALYGLFILLFTFASYSSASERLTLSAIYNLKNPYREKTDNNPELVYGSAEFIRFNGLFDRFEYCQTDGMIIFIAFANHIAVMKQAGTPETKFEAMKYMAKYRNLEYPFDAEEIAGSSERSVQKLAIEMGWEHPGSSDAHLESIASIYWEKCLQLPISIFEAEWKETEDITVFDENGLTREGDEGS